MKANAKNPNVIKGNTYSRRGVTILAVSAIVIVATGVNISLGWSARSTVSVVRLKQNEPLIAGSVIGDDSIEQYDVTKKDYTPDMALWKNKSKYVGEYAKNFIRGGTFLYTDEVSEDKPVRNPWLYAMPDNMEAITVPYNPLEAGGKLLIPGDKVRIRVTYNSADAAAAKQEQVLFDSIEVKDMLNSQGNSIYDIYSQIAKLPESTRAATMQTPAFLSSVTPVALLIESTKDQADQYTQYKVRDKATFSIDLLSRNGNKSIQVDQLPPISTDVASMAKAANQGGSSASTSATSK